MGKLLRLSIEEMEQAVCLHQLELLFLILILSMSLIIMKKQKDGFTFLKVMVELEN